MDAADLIEKEARGRAHHFSLCIPSMLESSEADLAWKSRQFDLSKLASCFQKQRQRPRFCYFSMTQVLPV